MSLYIHGPWPFSEIKELLYVNISCENINSISVCLRTCTLDALAVVVSPSFFFFLLLVAFWVSGRLTLYARAANRPLNLCLQSNTDKHFCLLSVARAFEGLLWVPLQVRSWTRLPRNERFLPSSPRDALCEPSTGAHGIGRSLRGRVPSGRDNKSKLYIYLRNNLSLSDMGFTFDNEETHFLFFSFTVVYLFWYISMSSFPLFLNFTSIFHLFFFSAFVLIATVGERIIKVAGRGSGQHPVRCRQRKPL